MKLELFIGKVSNTVERANFKETTTVENVKVSAEIETEEVAATLNAIVEGIKAEMQNQRPTQTVVERAAQQVAKSEIAATQEDVLEILDKELEKIYVPMAVDVITKSVPQPKIITENIVIYLDNSRRRRKTIKVVYNNVMTFTVYTFRQDIVKKAAERKNKLSEYEIRRFLDNTNIYIEEFEGAERAKLTDEEKRELLQDISSVRNMISIVG